MTLRPLLAAAALLACTACGSHTAAGSATPQKSSRQSVDAFLDAVADSNLTRMANLWGTSKGPAAQTGDPADWQRRVQIMQSYLRGTSHRVIAEDTGPDADRRVVQVEIRRGECVYMVPFTTIRSNGGWIVNSFDLSAVGSPGRSQCQGTDG